MVGVALGHTKSFIVLLRCSFLELGHHTMRKANQPWQSGPRGEEPRCPAHRPGGAASRQPAPICSHASRFVQSRSSNCLRHKDWLSWHRVERRQAVLATPSPNRRFIHEQNTWLLLFYALSLQWSVTQSRTTCQDTSRNLLIEAPIKLYSHGTIGWPTPTFLHPCSIKPPSINTRYAPVMQIKLWGRSPTALSWLTVPLLKRNLELYCPPRWDHKDMDLSFAWSCKTLETT